MDSPADRDTIAPEVQQPAETTTNRKAPFPRGFLDTISTGWADRPETLPSPREQSAWAARRRLPCVRGFPR